MTITLFTTLALLAIPTATERFESELTEKQVKENEERLLSRARKLTFAGKRSGEPREYLIEIDSEGFAPGNDTFRWSIDGAHIINCMVGQ